MNAIIASLLGLFITLTSHGPFSSSKSPALVSAVSTSSIPPASEEGLSLPSFLKREALYHEVEVNQEFMFDIPMGNVSEGGFSDITPLNLPLFKIKMYTKTEDGKKAIGGKIWKPGLHRVHMVGERAKNPIQFNVAIKAKDTKYEFYCNTQCNDKEDTYYEKKYAVGDLFIMIMTSLVLFFCGFQCSCACLGWYGCCCFIPSCRR